jgi:flagellar motor switch/type III secretory pathway protein FliN
MAEAPSALVQAKPGDSSDVWEEAGWLQCRLSVELPVQGFTIRDLLQLSVGSILETQWKSGHDLPLRANRRQIGWVEFEALGAFLAIRLTELCGNGTQ